MKKQGISQRAYAKHARVSGPYVSKLIRKGKLPVLADGSLDPVARDRARSQNTNMVRGELRRLRQAARLRQVSKDAHCP